MKGTLTLLLLVSLQSAKAQFIAGIDGFSVKAGTSVVIDQLALIPDADFTMVESEVELSSTPFTGIPSNSIARVYTIDPAISNFTGTFGIYFENSELNGNQASNLALAYSGNPNATALTITSPASSTGNYVSYNFNTPQSLGKITATSESSLPVTLTRFEVKREGTMAKIEWSTVSEINNSHFIVERSTDARTFQTLTIVSPEENSNGNNRYYVFDETPYRPTTYYRLKQVDLDERVTIFSIRALLWKEVAADQQIIAYPIPAQNHLQLKLPQHFENPLTFDLFDLAGRNVYSGKFTTKDTIPQIQLPNNLPSGSYILRLKSDWFDQSVKIIIAH